MTGLVVLAFLPFAGVLGPLPQAVLAATVIAGVFRLVAFGPLVRVLALSRSQGVVAWSTFALTLVLAPRIDLAVLLGVGMGVAVHLWRERRIEVHTSFDDGTLTLEPVGVLYFGSAPLLDDAMLAELEAHRDATRLVIDLRRVGRIDYTGALVIQEVAREAEAAGLAVVLVPSPPPQGERMLRRLLGADAERWLAKTP